MLETLQYKNVNLSNSLWKTQRDHIIELYLGLRDEDILQSAFRAAGVYEADCMEASGRRGLPGWGGTFGQMLGSFAKLFAVTRDFRLRAKAVNLFEQWASLSNKHEELFRLGTYDYEKMLGGLLDMDEIMGYGANGRIRASISRLTDVAIDRFDQSIPRDGVQDARMRGQIEWYTLPENLYRAWQRYGDDKYRQFAKCWRYDYFWNNIGSHDFSIGPRHAYSHVNAFSSLAREYEVTGEQTDLDILQYGYEELLQHHTYATGGYGPGENLFMDRDGYLGFMLMSPWDLSGEDPTFTNFAGERVARSDAWGSCEVSCCTWAVFKFCNYMLRFTGDARFGVWAERMLINCSGGQPDIKPNGELLYYSNYFADGGMKSTVDRRLQREGQNFQWQCCSGTFPQDVAEYSNMLYYTDAEALYISQYIPSSVLWKRNNGDDVSIENFSDWPNSDMLRFHINSPERATFTLRFRVPDWADGDNAVRINGRFVQKSAKPNTWITMKRQWSGDDIVEIVFPYRLRFTSVDQKRPELVALSYGPIVLVSDEMTLLVGDKEHPENWIVPSALTFRTLPGHTGALYKVCRTFTPYYTYPENKWYFMYHRIYPSAVTQKEAVRLANM